MKRNALALAAALTLIAAKPLPPPAGPLDPLPLEAQVAMEKGIDAAKAGDNVKALDLFRTAGYKAENSAVLFLNRGLLEARIPGRELRAVAWFGAYLDANPTAPNAAAIRSAISDLLKRSDATGIQLAKGYADAVGSGWQGNFAKTALCLAYLRAGDLPNAEAVMNAVTSADKKSPLQVSLAEAKVKKGDLAGARALVAAAEASGETGNYEGFGNLLGAVALAQSKAGDKAGAAQTLAFLRKMPEKYGNDASSRSQAHGRVARAMFAAGDAAGAKTEVTNALIWAQKADSSKVYRIEEGGEIQAVTGDLDGARATAEALKGEEFWRAQVLRAVAGELTKAGKDAEARVTAEQAEPVMQPYILLEIADQQIKAGRTAQANITLADVMKMSESIKIAVDRTTIQCNVAYHQTMMGDYEAARATLALAARSQKKIPLSKGDTFWGPDGNQRNGAEKVSNGYKEIAWREKPWTRWTGHLLSQLETAPFPDVVAHAQNLKNSYSDPEQYLSALGTALEAIPKERDLIDKMLAGGPPY